MKADQSLRQVRRGHVRFLGPLGAVLGALVTFPVLGQDAGAALRDDSAREVDAAPSADVVPPEVVERRDASYPARAIAERLEGVTTLLVTVEVDGSVGDVEVAESAGEVLDAEAVQTVRTWTFRPARRNGAPVRAKIRVPFEFQLPVGAAPEPAPGADSLPAAPALAERAAGSSAPEAQGSRATAAAEVEVHGERPLRTEQRSASDFVVGRELMQAAPHAEGADVLRTTPGLYMARAEGLAVGHRYMLRGFDADHGQDLELRVGGLPINLPSHIHGQGYADLGFLIGETVREVHAIEGVHDPRQGDFAVAGTLDIRLGVAQRGLRASTRHGSFGTSRQLLSWAPAEVDDATFAAAQLQQTDGFGDNRQGKSGSAIAQWGGGAGALRYRALAIVHAARARLAGVLRADDIADGSVGYYSVYPFETARAQNALSTRALLGMFAEYRGERGESAEASAWVSFDDFRSQHNYTGFIQQSQTLPNVAGRGDLIEQLNRTRSLGASARYRTPVMHAASWLSGMVEAGLSARVDGIAQAQNLIDATVRSQTWDQRVDADILGTDIGLWGDLDWHVHRHVALRLGMRADVLSYSIDDRLGNRVTLTRPEDTFIAGFRRSALGIAWGPRATAEVRPVDGLSFHAAYGEGYRSPQARTLDDGEEAPFSKVRSADVGVRLGDTYDYRLTLSGYYTHLSDDVAFDAEEGRLERIGATRRVGAVAHIELHPTSWLVGAASATFVDAELLEPPPPSAEEPQPPFREGQNLPFVPPLVLRADLGLQRSLGLALGSGIEGRAGLGFSFLSARPLPYGELADPVALLDAALAITWAPLELGFEVHNLLDTRYAASELNFASDWRPGSARSRVPARHIAAGAPRAWLITVGVSL